MSDSKKSSGGIGTLGVLGIVFIVLKLTGNIGWSWWWVLSPFYPSVILIFIFISYFIYKYISAKRNKKTWQERLAIELSKSKFYTEKSEPSVQDERKRKINGFLKRKKI